MSIEKLIADLIESNNAVVASNKELVIAINSGLSVSQADSGAATTTRKRRTKAEIEADEAAAKAQQAGETASTEPAYYVLEATKQVFEVPAGGQPPARFSAQVTKEVYEQKKAEFEAKKAEAAATTQASAATEPTATAPAANASGATSTADGVTYADVRAKLMELSKMPEHGAAAVKAILTKAAPGIANVPGLDGSGFEAAVMAEINALLNPAAAGEVDLF